MAGKRARRKVFLWFVGLLVVFVVVVALLPALLSLGIAPAIVTGAINDRVQGKASIDRLQLRWLGDQAVEGLTIIDAEGVEAVNVNATLGKGLLPILLGAMDGAELSVDGTLRGELRSNGSTSFGELFRSEELGAGAGESDAEKDEPPTRRDEPFRLAGFPAMDLRIDGVRVELTLDREEKEEDGQAGAVGEARGVDEPPPAVRTLVLESLTGSARYRPGGTSVLQLTSPTTADDLSGSLELEATATGLFDADGALTPSAAAVDAEFAVHSVPILFARDRGTIDALALSVSTDDLADRLEIAIDGEAALADGEPSMLTGSLTLSKPVRADGGVNAGLDNLAGTLTGRRVPSALLQPTLAKTPVTLESDLGKTFDVTAEFSRGAEKETTISLTGPQATIELAAAVAPDGAVDGRRLEAQAVVRRELVAELAGIDVGAPMTVNVVLDSFHLPARRGGKIPLSELAFDGRLTMTESHAITLPVDPPAMIAISNIMIAARTTGLAKRIDIDGSVNLDEGTITLEQQVGGLVDAAGELALEAARPIGRIELTGLDGARLTPLLGKAGADPAVAMILAGDVSASLETSSEDEGLLGDLRFRTDTLDARGSAVQRGGTLRIASGEAIVTLTPALVAAVQEDSEEPIRLEAPAKAVITVRPFDLAGDFDSNYTLPETPIEATIALDDAQLAHGALEEPVRVRRLKADVAARLGAALAWSANGDAQIDRTDDGGRVSALAFDLGAEDDRPTPRGTITADRLVVRNLEAVLGLARDTLAGWVGREGAVTAVLSDDTTARRLTLRSNLDNLKGEMRLAMEKDAVSVSAEALRFSLGREAATSMLRPPTGDAKESAITVTGDVPFTASLKEFRVPLALTKGKSFDPKTVTIEATLEGGPLELANADGVFSSLRDLRINAKTEDLAQGIELTLTGSTAAPQAMKEGEISITGTLDGLVSDENAFDRGGAILTMTADAQRVPTVIADALLDLEGLLVAAVGEEMSVTFESKRFSPNTGWVDGRIETTNGFLEGIVKGREDSLKSTQQRPIIGELDVTPPLRDRLLEPIHPIFADIRSVEHPVRFTVPKRLILPLDGDVGRLKADLEIDVGPVEFDSGSLMLRLMRRFDTPEETIPGSIELIEAEIRKGVVGYERFAVHIGKYTLIYEGEVDLNTRTVDLRTELPLEALALTFEELEGYVDKIIVPIWTHGPLEKPKTEIHPDFDLAEAAARAGFRGVLRDILKDRGNPFGDILDDLLRRAEEGGDGNRDD
ncbi:MAG: hypothetical protein SYC29_02570 [Planctomycetota bacterium]|nr:hypothetical protein [Planctomycetota bacterium]